MSRAVAAARGPVADAVHHELGLVALVVGAVEPDRLAPGALGPELLADAPGVVGDDGVGRGEDGARGAVVLLELEGLHAREVAAELLQVLHAGAAPAVDGLVVVAHHVGEARRADERLHPVVLDGVGVLELVHQHVAEAGAVVLDEPRCLAPQLVAPEQQLGEVHHAVALAGFLVGLVQLDHLPARRVAVVLEVLGAQALVLLRVDEPRHLARHPARLVEAEPADQALDEALLVLGVEDREALRQAGLAPVHAQQPVRDAVEGADPQRCRGQAELRLDARTHLARRLVGEGHGEDAVRRDALDLHQPGDAVREHARLAAAGAGEHQRRGERRRDRLPLCVVQRVEKMGDVHGRARILANPRTLTRAVIAGPRCASPPSRRGTRNGATGPSPARTAAGWRAAA